MSKRGSQDACRRVPLPAPLVAAFVAGRVLPPATQAWRRVTGRAVWYGNRSIRIESTVALSIKDPEADRLAREVARATGETLTAAVVQSLRERLLRIWRPKGRPLSAELLRIGERCAALPVLDDRSADQILDYDAHGLPR